jgi:hypothetical protein
MLPVALDPVEAGLATVGGGLLGLAAGVGLGVSGPLSLVLAVVAALAALVGVASMSVVEAADRAVRRLEAHLSMPELLDAVEGLGPVEVTALAGLRRT